MYVLWL
jgi:hypothetical protein